VATADDRRALVTGASRGVGRAVARRLVEDGWRVTGVHRSSGSADALAGELGERFTAVRADLVADDEIARVVAAARQRGALAAVVLAAGTTMRAPFVEGRADADPIFGQLRDDLVAPLRLVRALLRADAVAHGGSIVFVGSNLGHRGVAGKVAYAAAKGGIEAATRSLARELGPAGVRVNTVAPGLLRTDMTAELDDDAWRRYAALVPLGRAGEADDVAGPIAFLVGDDARYVTGQVLDVDGGWGV
jgi:NAD(P)-dependent dehydrogenase (short-subunit alcohol dehydrogenase family)